MNTIDDAKMGIDQFLKSYESFKNEGLSESDTRSKVIDYVLINVLGWEEINIKREAYGDNGYYDYKLSIPGFSFVIEAKKQFVDFTIPQSKSRKCKLGIFYNENVKVVDQIRGYLDDNGCDVGVITNGKQYIIAKFRNNDGTSWKQNDCIIYNGLVDISEHIIEFWNDLSYECIVQNRGIESVQRKIQNFSKTIVSAIPQKGNEIMRNQLTANTMSTIDDVFGMIFSNIPDDNNEDFIKACYVESNEIKKHKSELTRIFGDDAPKYKEVIPAKNHSSVKQKIEEEISDYTLKSKTYTTPHPIIIIGSKGVGKTTFINYLFKYDIKDSSIIRCPYVYLNLIQYYNGENNLNLDHISKAIIDEIDKNYPRYNIYDNTTLQRIYKDEIKKKRKSVWSCYQDGCQELNEKISNFLEAKINDTQEHLKKVNMFLTETYKTRIILIFDNADQLSDAVQRQLFLFACALNTSAKYGVIISLREGYYNQWRQKPPFNAFESNVYHIISPDYMEVLRKRIKYIIEIISNKKAEYVTNGKNIEVSREKIKEFFLSIEKSLFSDAGSPIIDYINYTTYPNIREGLNIFKIFVKSGYNDVQEYVERLIFDETGVGKAYIPMHEFIQTIALGNRLYYDHENSEVSNLFYPDKEGTDYFIKIYLLLSLHRTLNDYGKENKSVICQQLVQEFLEYGYKESVLKSEIRKLINKHFIETEVGILDVNSENPEIDSLEISLSSKGMYYLNNMICRFYYIDLVLQDTPIYDEKVFNDLQQIFPKRDAKFKRALDKRVKVVSAFMDYLSIKEDEFVPESVLKNYGSIIRYIKEKGLDRDIKFISNKVEQNRQKMLQSKMESK